MCARVCYRKVAKIAQRDPINPTPSSLYNHVTTNESTGHITIPKVYILFKSPSFLIYCLFLCSRIPFTFRHYVSVGSSDCDSFLNLFMVIFIVLRNTNNKKNVSQLELSEVFLILTMRLSFWKGPHVMSQRNPGQMANFAMPIGQLAYQSRKLTTSLAA